MAIYQHFLKDFFFSNALNRSGLSNGRESYLFGNVNALRETQETHYWNKKKKQINLIEYFSGFGQCIFPRPPWPYMIKAMFTILNKFNFNWIVLVLSKYTRTCGVGKLLYARTYIRCFGPDIYNEISLRCIQYVPVHVFSVHIHRMEVLHRFSNVQSA